MTDSAMTVLCEKFGNRVQKNVLLKNYTTIRTGGYADALLIALDALELEQFVSQAWELELPVLVLGGGSNILVSDRGVRGVVIINHAHNVQIHARDDQFIVHAEAGALMGKVANLSINRGMTGLEWAATLPGTVGGAVYGNAGCFGKETADNFIQAEILHQNKGKIIYNKEEMAFEYRSSILKRNPIDSVVLSADFAVTSGNSAESTEMVNSYRERRMKNQPPGPSMGSIFRNPPDNKAGRMIEAVGLKGFKLGGAEISAQHGNFIINGSNGNAQDIWKLIKKVESEVNKKFGIFLIPEIQLVGEWDETILNEFNLYQTNQEIA